MNAGIPCGIGTDTFPHNMLDELRMACYAGPHRGGEFYRSKDSERVHGGAAVEQT